MSERPWLCPRDETCRANRHDTHGAYRHGCRSGAALAARRRWDKHRAAGKPLVRRVPALGARRRLQALHALGHTWPVIAAELGLDRRNVRHLATGDNPWITPRKHDLIAAVYDKLSMQLPAPGQFRDRARRDAAEKSWAPPLAWDNVDDPDEAPQHRARPSRAPRVDHTEAIARLTRAGRSAAEIAEQLGINPRTVTRTRTRLRLEGERDADAA